MAKTVTMPLAEEIDPNDGAQDAEVVPERQPGQVPAVQQPKKMNAVDQAYADSDFEGLGEQSTFLPGVSLDNGGMFVFKDTEEERKELRFRPCSCRPVLEHYDETEKVFYKSYDNGQTLHPSGDDFGPWRNIAKKKGEIEFYDGEGDEARLVQFRASQTVWAAFKNAVAKLLQIHGKRLNEVDFVLTPTRATNAKLKIKYWTAVVTMPGYPVPEGTIPINQMGRYAEKYLALAAEEQKKLGMA